MGQLPVARISYQPGFLRVARLGSLWLSGRADERRYKARGRRAGWWETFF